MNTENVITLWNGLKKEDYLRLLKEKTYQYNLTNTYMANSFLSKIQKDKNAVMVCNTSTVYGNHCACFRSYY
mgnify:FL=1